MSIQLFYPPTVNAQTGEAVETIELNQNLVGGGIAIVEADQVGIPSVNDFEDGGVFIANEALLGLIDDIELGDFVLLTPDGEITSRSPILGEKYLQRATGFEYTNLWGGWHLTSDKINALYFHEPDQGADIANALDAAIEASFMVALENEGQTGLPTVGGRVNLPSQGAFAVGGLIQPELPFLNGFELALIGGGSKVTTLILDTEENPFGILDYIGVNRDTNVELKDFGVKVAGTGGHVDAAILNVGASFGGRRQIPAVVIDNVVMQSIAGPNDNFEGTWIRCEGYHVNLSNIMAGAETPTADNLNFDTNAPIFSSPAIIDIGATYNARTYNVQTYGGRIGIANLQPYYDGEFIEGDNGEAIFNFDERNPWLNGARIRVRENDDYVDAVYRVSFIDLTTIALLNDNDGSPVDFVSASTARLFDSSGPEGGAHYNLRNVYAETGFKFHRVLPEPEFRMNGGHFNNPRHCLDIDGVLNFKITGGEYFNQDTLGENTNAPSDIKLTNASSGSVDGIHHFGGNPERALWELGDNCDNITLMAIGGHNLDIAHAIRLNGENITRIKIDVSRLSELPDVLIKGSGGYRFVPGQFQPGTDRLIQRDQDEAFPWAEGDQVWFDEGAEINFPINELVTIRYIDETTIRLEKSNETFVDFTGGAVVHARTQELPEVIK